MSKIHETARSPRFTVAALVAVAFLVLAGTAGVLVADGAASAADRSTTASSVDDEGESRFTGDREETERFLARYRSIELTSEQEKIRFEALDALPAPCCSQFTAATCCCECNMAKATWGLAKHLIAKEGADAEEVREAVSEWHRAINPDGFSGRSCFNGGCTRAFEDDGCGGMREGHLVF